MSIVALIPARGGSKSIPDKNIVNLLGNPLIEYTIKIAKESKFIDRVIVSTDSEKISEISLKLGAEVPFLRPADISRDESPDIDVFSHAVDWLKNHQNYQPDLFVHLRVTSPFRETEVIDDAIDKILNNPNADSLRSISIPNQSPFKMWKILDDKLRPLIHTNIPDHHSMPRQTLPTVYWQNCYVDIVRTKTIKKYKSMTGKNIIPYIIKSKYILDIDDEMDLVIAEIVGKKYFNKKF